VETDPEGALVGFAEVVKMEGEKGEWYVKVSFRVGTFLLHFVQG
jgi:COP9 signalosome complex subunit 2